MGNRTIGPLPFVVSGPLFSGFIRAEAEPTQLEHLLKRNARDFSRSKQEDVMKKSWTKPSMCQTAAGMEISRYLPAEITPRK